MSTEIIDFKIPSKVFKLEVQGFVVLSFGLHRRSLEFRIRCIHEFRIRCIHEFRIRCLCRKV